MTKVYSGIPPHFGKLQIWDDQSLLWNTPPPISEIFRFGMTKVYSRIPPPFWKTSDLRWPKFTPEHHPPFQKTSDLGWPKFTPEYPWPKFTPEYLPPFRKSSDLGWPKFTPEYPPPLFRKLQIWDDQSLLRNTPPMKIVRESKFKIFRIPSYYMWRLYPTRITTSSSQLTQPWCRCYVRARLYAQTTRQIHPQSQFFNGDVDFDEQTGSRIHSVAVTIDRFLRSATVVAERLCFYRCLSVHRGCTLPPRQTPPGQTPPPPGRHPLLGRHPHPQADTTSSADTPPAHTPLPPPSRPPPGRHPKAHTPSWADPPPPPPRWTLPRTVLKTLIVF